MLSTYIGTNDDGATESDPTGGGSDPDNNMVLVTANEYDGGNKGGDGNLTSQTQYVTAADTRVTTFGFDWRDRRITTDGELDLFQKDYFDNLDHLVKTELYDTAATGHLVARSETKFDNRGRIYRTLRYGVDPSTGTVGNTLTDSTWYDAAGHKLASLPAGSFLFTKSVYDSLARAVALYIGYNPDADLENPLGSGSPDSIDDDVVLEQSETDYDNASNVIESRQRQRYHNAPATQTGALQNPSTTPKARVTYAAQYPDALGRTAATADYGTNGGSVLDRSDTVPDRADDVLVTSTVFDDAGNPESTTDPAGVVTRFHYDDRGRGTERIANYDGSSLSSACDDSDDVNVTVQTTYDADSNLFTITAVNSSTGDQTTQYVYGTTLADSDIATSFLKRAEVYPDSSSGSDQIAFSYNATTASGRSRKKPTRTARFTSTSTTSSPARFRTAWPPSAPASTVRSAGSRRATTSAA